MPVVLSIPEVSKQRNEMIITSELIRAARALLRWEQKDLAVASGISLPSIKRLESQPGPLAAQDRTVMALRAAIDRAGVEFTNGGQPGVRMKAGEWGPIYIDAGKSAVLEHGAKAVRCFTVQEAKIEFDKLPPERKEIATITTGGRKYSTFEIERFHYGPQAKDALPAISDEAALPEIPDDVEPYDGAPV